MTLRALAALGLGALAIAGFAPWGWFAIPLLALAGLAWLWQGAANPRAAALLGLCFGVGFFGTGVSWIYVSLHDFGEMPLLLAGLATAGFCLFLALFPALAGWLFLRLGAGGGLRGALRFAAAWTLVEWLRGTVFTGFPWLSVGYSQVPTSPLAGYAPILGTYGTSLAVALSAGLFAAFAADVRGVGASALRGPSAWGLAAVWALGGALTLVHWTAPAGAALEVALVQGNIAQDMKWRPQWLRATLETYEKLTLSARGRLLVLPETALPMLNVDVPAAYVRRLSAHAQAQGADLLLGLPEYVPGEQPRYYNSVFSLGTSAVQVYRKHHLVPFGDYLPYRPLLGFITAVLHLPMSDFTHGTLDQRPLQVGGQSVAVNICYEDAFGEEIISQLPQATLLANFTNDAWWGDSLAPEQHLQLAQMRSLETGRYLLRATNTGVSAIIDEKGRVVSRAPKFTAAVLSGHAQGFSGSTPYVRWGNLACALLIAVLLALSWRRPKSRA